jgi:hypothetical protein
MDVDGRLIRGLQNRGEWGGLARVYKYVYVCLRPGRSAGRRQHRPVVLHVVIRPKIDAILDERAGRVGNFERKSIVSRLSGRKVSEFGTVRPRVQIPGPRPVFEYESQNPRLPQRPPGHSRVTISPGSSRNGPYGHHQALVNEASVSFPSGSSRAHHRRSFQIAAWRR